LVTAVLLVPSAALAHESRRPQLKLVDRSPLVVRGTGFKPRERVRVELSVVASELRRVRTTRAGTFTVAFARVTVHRCDSVRIVAVGTGGSHAALKLLPAPACSTG
jgi:hypothetical protein